MLKILMRYNNQLINLNFGPQHPAAHGVLRCLLQLSNEVIVKCDPHIGLLHRGSETLVTTKPFYLSLPYFDRMDYVSVLCQEHCYCLAVERSQKKYILPLAIDKTRVLLSELTRILNHLLAISCHALDIGSMSPIFWAFEEREKLMQIYEHVSGARMHAAFFRPLFGHRNLSTSNILLIMTFSKNFSSSLSEINFLLHSNKIWKSRLKNLGIVRIKDLHMFGLTGVFLRSTGIKNDLRLSIQNTYSFYRKLYFYSFIAWDGDSYSRYVIRMFEMLESTTITLNILFNIQYNDFNLKLGTFYSSMEVTIDQFKLWSGTIGLIRGQTTCLIESPKGIFGVSLYLNKTSTPNFCKVRSPSYNHLLWLKYSTKNTLLSDLVSFIGTIDIVFGEIDR